ncbi:lactonase family protein [Pendulispora rubella]|uniref:Lactonase family protein n=1 Tax=Pendulispora rubella TaxID=2741070 RepID=A0ABZ2LAL8_9BACT
MHLRRTTALLGILGSQACAGGPGSDPAQASALDAIGSPYVAVLSDGDFFASTYVDGQLPGPDPRYRDTLSILLPGRAGEPRSARLPDVSNSVAGPPEVLALAPDNRTAYVIELLQPRAPGMVTRDDLPPGRRLTAVDLSNPAKPRLRGFAYVGPLPEALSVHPGGRWIALTTNAAEEGIQLVAVRGQGELGPVTDIPLAALDVPTRADLPKNGLDASYLAWHPGGKLLAVNLYRQGRIVFLRFTQDAAGAPVLSRWGAPVAVDEDAYTGRFTPDGRYYVVNAWGRNFNATTPDQRLPEHPGSLSVIRLGALDAPEPVHAVVHRAESDRSPEGMAMSPDGTLVATCNMRETIFPESHPRYTREATVSLFQFDGATGALAKVGDYPFEAVLPEGIAFDASGRHLLAASFEYRGSQEPHGGLEVWRIARTPAVSLRHVGRVELPPGAHAVAVATH